MRATEVKVTRIGNSRGVRIPADVLRRYAFADTAVLVESADGVLLRPKRQAGEKLSWADTAKAMAATSEDWSEWEAATADGLETLPWEQAGVAEKRPGYGKAKRAVPRRHA